MHCLALDEDDWNLPIRKQGLGDIGDKVTLGYNEARQRKTVEWSDGITEQWGCCLPGQGQGHPTLDADLCPVSWFHLYIVPRSPHLKPFFKPWKVLQMGSDIRLAIALLGYQRTQKGESEGCLSCCGNHGITWQIRNPVTLTRGTNVRN